MRGAIRAWLERALGVLWYAPPASLAPRIAATLLFPLTAITALIATRRRRAIRRLPPQTRPAVVVIGNLTVGGTGKTPATLAAAQALATRGWTVGLVCAGYRAQRSEARMVRPDSSPRADGDEAVLLAARSGVPVAAARARGEALALLRLRHPEIGIVLSDDGLQHAGLERTLEVAVFDARGIGNARLLPAGPLREPITRVATLDAILLNATDSPAGGVPETPACPRFRFELRPSALRALGSGESLAPAAFAARFSGRSVAAIAGIGHPQRFFAMLREAGIRFESHAPGDHARFDPGALARLHADAIVMTDKDAVKCAGFADDRCWVLETDTRIDPAFIDWIEERLRGYPIA